MLLKSYKNLKRYEMQSNPSNLRKGYKIFKIYLNVCYLFKIIKKH